jgi:1-acyl-sn-glycerol-3-phosphate acyltransferase
MIKATHNKWLDAGFRFFMFNSLFPWCFDEIDVQGPGSDTQTIQTIADPPEHRGVLYIANHSSWWDGLLIHYIMMDEAQLKSRKLFSKLGAFSIDKSSPKRSLQALQYAAEKLKEGHSVWIFPQGDIHHLESRPLVFESGFAHVLHLYSQAVVCPVTFYYTSGLFSKLTASIEIGSPIGQEWTALTRKQISEQLNVVLTNQLEQHKQKEMKKVDNHRGN